MDESKMVRAFQDEVEALKNQVSGCGGHREGGGGGYDEPYRCLLNFSHPYEPLWLSFSRHPEQRSWRQIWQSRNRKWRMQNT